MRRISATVSLPVVGARDALRVAFCVVALAGLALGVACSLSPQPLPPGETASGPTPQPKEPAADAATNSGGVGAVPSADGSAPDAAKERTDDAGDAGDARDASDAADASDASFDAQGDAADGSRE